MKYNLFILSICLFLGVASACNDHFMRNGAWCYSGNNCAFGCHKGYCWSECNGKLTLAEYCCRFRFSLIGVNVGLPKLTNFDYTIIEFEARLYRIDV